MKQAGTPTMKDVAREAGVSLGTVSKVINGLPVGEHCRKLVDAAVEKLGYQVNNYARGLKTNKTYCVALIMPSLHHPFFAALTNELTACLMRHGYMSILMITNYDCEAEKKCFTLARQNKIDGIIALSYSPNLENVDISIPLITIDRHFSNDLTCISSDNFRGGEIAAQKLMELGCKKLLCLRIGPHIYGEAEKRCAGFSNACMIANVENQVLFHFDEETEEPFYQFLEAHMQNGKPEYDGIFCNSDGLAVHICNFLRGKGIRIPEDVQIIGYDGITDYASGQYSCSTIVQPVTNMAETAVQLLLLHDSGFTPANIVLPVQYASGGTTRE